LHHSGWAAKTRIFEQVSREHIDFMLSKIPRGRFWKVDAE
jgi:3-oxoacyl-[acyl-carrier protein] reductase